METVVLITNTRENELQFDMIVEGTNVEDLRARFVIKSDGFDYVFPCVQSDTAKQLNVIIPKLPQLAPGMYDFCIEVITNGYYFDPYSNKLEVVAEPIVVPSKNHQRLPVPVIGAIDIKGGESINVNAKTSQTIKAKNKPRTKVNVTSLEVKPEPSPVLKKRKTSNVPIKKRKIQTKPADDSTKE